MKETYMYNTGVKNYLKFRKAKYKQFSRHKAIIIIIIFTVIKHKLESIEKSKRLLEKSGIVLLPISKLNDKS